MPFRGLLLVSALAALTPAVLGLAIGASADRISRGGFCRGTIVETSTWTPPLLPNTDIGLRQAGIGCRRAKQLVRSLLPGGIGGLPHSRAPSSWSCRLVQQADIPYVDCQRRRRGVLNEVSFRSSPRLAVDVGVQTYGCAAQALAFFAPTWGAPSDPPVTYAIDYGGAGGYDQTETTPFERPWVYEHPGSYTVRATATDARGVTVSKETNVRVAGDERMPCTEAARPGS